MKTQIELAREGVLTTQMATVAAEEKVTPDYVLRMVAEGKIVIPWNHSRKPKAVGIGKGLSTKVNASIGTSSDIIDYDAEIAKALAAQESGADTLMELSVGGDLDRVRREVIAAVDLSVGNVPLYQAFCEAARKYGDPNKLDEEMLFDIIEKQCADGMAFMAVHCGINLCTIERLRKQGYRYGGLVSKGGVSMVAWMIANNRENPLYEHFDRVVSILKKYDTVLSLGNGLRAGAIRFGADLICYITPAEHLALPNEEDVRMGVKAAKIAAYIGDMNKYPEKGRERDKEMSKARRDLEWGKQFELALYPEDARAIRASRTPEDEATCTMCGDFCASRGAGKLFSGDLRGDKV